MSGIPKIIDTVTKIVNANESIRDCLLQDGTVDFSKFLQLALTISGKIQLIATDLKGAQKYEILRTILLETIDFVSLTNDELFAQKEALRTFIDGPLKFSIEAAIRVSKGQYQDLAPAVIETATVCCSFLASSHASLKK